MALDEILVHKRAEVAQRRAEPLEALIGRCAPSERGFERAIRRRPGFILEVKSASPSAGTIRLGDLAAVVASYDRHADAISVVTDSRFFGGSLARLAAVRAKTGRPLLCKDFILEPYQVAEARIHGADAVLLILAAIDDASWHACAALAARLGMAVLTEAHDEHEVRRAVALGARIIGINNRDLRTFEIDLRTTLRLASLVPTDRLVVSESGIASHEDVLALKPHAGAFLVGGALMREPDVDRAVRHLVYGRTKICGLTSPDDARAALAAGATHGGLVFAGRSPRLVNLARAEDVRASAPLAWVGVFADHDPEVVAEIAAHLDLAAVQLHGEESKAAVARTRSRVRPSCEVWKSIRVRGAIPALATTGAERLLLDGGPGGSGRAFDWSWLERHPERGAAVLAGGLNAGNAARAASLATYALDVSSGVEEFPGKKDPDRLRAFLQARR